MRYKKIKRPKTKSKLHLRNKHRNRYDFAQLTATCPALAPFVIQNAYNDESIDFFDPAAVKQLNTALLQHYYGIKNWDIPANYLCPPIPGRADYIHHIADVLASSNDKKIPTGASIRCLDIGVGANCIYPLIGHKEFGWSFVGTEIDPIAIESANKIISDNNLQDSLEIRLQSHVNNVFQGIIKKKEYFDLSICNPPFHSSAAEAAAATRRKIKNLDDTRKAVLNFGGQNNELWCKGGEKRFVQQLIRQSKQFPSSCFWYSSLVSKHSNLRSIYDTLEATEAVAVKTIPMGQGNKVSRIVAWTYLSDEQQHNWKAKRWSKANNLSI